MQAGEKIEYMKHGEGTTVDDVQREIVDGKNKQEAAFSPEHQIGNSFQRPDNITSLKRLFVTLLKRKCIIDKGSRIRRVLVTFIGIKYKKPSKLRRSKDH